MRGPIKRVSTLGQLATWLAFATLGAAAAAFGPIELGPPEAPATAAQTSFDGLRALEPKLGETPADRLDRLLEEAEAVTATDVVLDERAHDRWLPAVAELQGWDEPAAIAALAHLERIGLLESP